MQLIELASHLDRVGMTVLRIGLIIVLFWIGGLKCVDYEADSIVPLVANSPFLRFVYHFPCPAYRLHMNREGELVVKHWQWQEANGTYRFSKALGLMIIAIRD